MALLNRALVLFVGALCAGCERTPTQIQPQDSHIIVHGLLLAVEDSVRVSVARVDVRGTNLDESPLLPVVNARVRIVHGTDTTTLSAPTHCVDSTQDFRPNPIDLNEGCYAGRIAAGVRPGERYELLVDAAEGKARGEALVPALPVMHSPAPGITLQYSRSSQLAQASTVLVRWSGTMPDRRIELSVRPVRRECNASILRAALPYGGDRVIMIGGDTVTIVSSGVYCLDRDTTQSVFPAELLLTAYDDAYTRSLRLASPTLRMEGAAIGLTEGFGVFGAAATVAVPITLVRKDQGVGSRG